VNIRHGGHGREVEVEVEAATEVATTTTVGVDFKEIATATGTDKVAGYQFLPSCLDNRESCTRPKCEREVCRPWGHFYDTMYTKYLEKYTIPNSPPIQFLEIGYYTGKGFEAYTKYLNNDEYTSLNTLFLSTTSLY